MSSATLTSPPIATARLVVDTDVASFIFPRRATRLPDEDGKGGNEERERPLLHRDAKRQRARERRKHHQP